MKPYPEYLANLFPDSGKIDWVQQEAFLRRMLKEHPEDERPILNRLGQNLFMQEKDAECIELCHRQLQLDETDDDKTEHLFTIAKCYDNQGDFDKAIDFYHQCIAKDPEGSEESILNIADIYKQRNDWENALRTYDLLQAIDDDSAKAEELHGKGWVYIHKKKWDAALDCFMQGRVLFPQQECFPYGIGTVYGEQHQWDTALEWMVKAQEANPEAAEPHYGMGLCHQMKADFYRALHHYLEALKRQADFPEVHNNLAKLFLEHEGNVQKAIEMLEQAVKSATDEKQRFPYYFALNRVYNMIADYDKADYYNEKWLRSLGLDVEFGEDEEEEG